MRSLVVTVLILSLSAASCSDDIAANPGGVKDMAMGTGGDGGGNVDSGMAMMTTIHDARMGSFNTMPITVTAVVTALRGNGTTDTTGLQEWYIQDPAGGPYSGVTVFCAKATCRPTVPAPALNDLVVVTGSLKCFKGTAADCADGKLELYPTAETTMMPGATPPAPANVTTADLAEGGNAKMWRGQYVKVTLPAAVTVDDPTPLSLENTKCSMDDGGVSVALDGGISCSGCAPPAYGGFEVSDGTNKFVVEQHFYGTEHLQSSPECLMTMGAKAVTKGMTFSKLAGVLDYNVNSKIQTLSPAADADYTTP